VFARQLASTAGLPDTAAVLRNLGNGAEVLFSHCLSIHVMLNPARCQFVTRPFTQGARGLCCAQIHLVGTAHVSKASSEEVRNIIHAVQPQTVFVELDAQRAQQLRGGLENQNNLKARLVPYPCRCPLDKQRVLAFPRSTVQSAAQHHAIFAGVF